MSPTPEEGDPVVVKDSSIKAEDTPASEASKRQAAKRRTKTGCLTCRKRRIKCGEEKPVCKNCVKAKRECAGYVQPLIYKQQAQAPLTAFPIPTERFLSLQGEGIPPSGFLNLRLPSEQQYLGGYHSLNPSVPPPSQSRPFDASYHALPQLPSSVVPYPDPQAEAVDAWRHSVGPMYHGTSESMGQSVSGPPAAYGHEIAFPTSSFPTDPQSVGQVAIPGSQGFPVPYQRLPSAFPAYPRFAQGHQTPVLFHQPPPPHVQAVTHGSIDDNVARQYSVHGFIQHPYSVRSILPPTSMTAADTELATVDDDLNDPDDPFDVEMDESEMSFQDATDNLTQILDQSGQHSWWNQRPGTSRRVQSGTLAESRPAMTMSPLRDEKNERTFRHFVEITSQCVSIYERHHFSPIAAPARTLWNFTIPAMALSHAALAHAILATGGLHLAKLSNSSEDPAVKHFTYAVRRVGKLLSLPRRRHEIATLATILVLGFYEVLSGDHSRWNLHLSGATKLVLEHDYAGMIRQARRMRQGAKARVNQWTAKFSLTQENYGRVAAIPLALLDDIDWEVDATLISRLTGFTVDYDHQAQPNFESGTCLVDLSEKDVEDLKTKMDLRWWYCKQDVFQSLVSGDPLLMPYEHWRYCPPRGQIGRADNPYATFDHLLLVMARLADFGGKDRSRKQRAVAARGGQWTPPKWLFGPSGAPGAPGAPVGKGKAKSGSSHKSSGPDSGMSGASVKFAGQTATKPSPAPSANEGRVRQTRPGPSQGPGAGPTSSPPMFGMMPPPSEPVQMNSALRAMQASIRDPAYAVSQEPKGASPPRDLEDETSKAFAEHAEIAKAFEIFKRTLGPEFDPLPAPESPIATPFGPALVYRNAAIACTMAFYNVGRILLQRLHPEMHPAAMISAGVTAHLTRDYAQNVGKICAGLYSTQRYGQSGALDPAFGGELMESTFPLLFAGVQYTDAGQRGWTISKLQDVATRCGWRTSAAIAAACEIAWEKMGQAGKAPPYHRTLSRHDKDARVNGARLRGAPAAGQDDGGQQKSAAEAAHESEFVHHDRSLIDRSGSTRVHWALGLLSVEEDIKRMNLENG
ncbi:hypothetical protein A1O1_03703 [Capronia coronata CBS 617.96]|uniref:Zn(2)-C6 fungal-type domain-containing protein n=1 Tax=Capronia coronata CBS 617.96 TaxID=1182541 RepID=W9YLP4_9EURO|nr:uncharacterized protein A1O1_03703 [Capronia coronata CBS 617.96]EXJ90600.1 hypothetical protein A1O1_03703 [Capronia coronata CBS 617.96]